MKKKEIPNTTIIINNLLEQFLCLIIVKRLTLTG